MSKVRSSNLELLRIISMIMIIFNHISVHGKYTFLPEITLNECYTDIIAFGGKVGVAAFVLISSYFLIGKTELRLSKVLDVWIQCIFYSLTIFAFTYLLFRDSVNVTDMKSVMKTVLPFSYGCWWFATSYIILYLMSPYINRIISALTQAEYVRLLLLTGVMVSGAGVFFPKSYLANTNVFSFLEF